MRFRILILLMSLLAGIAQVSAAAPERWYFAQNLVDGQVIAYTAKGETNILLNGLTERGYGYALDEQSALAILNIDGTPGLFHLTPEAASQIPLSFDLAVLEDELIIRETHLPYVFMQIPGDASVVTGLLVNVETHTAEMISPTPVYFGQDSLRFSEDGQMLRYVRQGDNNSTWHLVERTLATGNEHIFFTIEEDRFARIAADRYGEHWLYGAPTEPVTYLLISPDASAAVLAEDSERLWGIFDDNVYATPLNCLENCAIELYPFDGGSNLTFVVPTSEGAVVPVHMSDASQLTAFDLYSSSLVNITPDGTASLLGYWTSLSVWTPFDEIFSSDGRWLLVVNDPENPTLFSLWDTANQQTAFEIPYTEPVEILYDDGGILIYEGTDITYLYLLSDELPVQLPHSDQGHYYAIADDGSILFWQYGDTMPPGLYTYDAATESYTLLIEAAEVLIP